MSEHPSLIELKSIVENSNLESRKLNLSKWIKKHLHYIEKTQYVVNKSVMSSDERDFIWECVTKQCLDELLDNNIITTKSTNTSFTGKLVTLGNYNGKLKEDKKDSEKT
jgi:hypothetical protein